MASFLKRSEVIWFLLAAALLVLVLLRRKPQEPVKLGDVNLQQGSKTDVGLQDSIDAAGQQLRTLLGVDSIFGHGTFATWGNSPVLTTNETACITDAGFVGSCALFEKLGLKRTG